MVVFCIVLGTKLYWVSIPSNAHIFNVFRHLEAKNADILGRTSYKQCKFHKIMNLVPLQNNNETDIIEKYLNESNMAEVSLFKFLKFLVPVLQNDHVYMVIKLLEGTP